MAAELPSPGFEPAAGSSPGAAPPPGLHAAAQLRSGPPARARLAASVIVVRDGDGDGCGVEVLLVQRNPAARTMGGVWVFPGGAVDAADGEGDRAHRAAAVRELAEEAGVAGVDPAGLVKFSRWITPADLASRFDTQFFVVPMPAGGPPPRVDGQECVALRWFTAQAALDAHADGRVPLVLPTIRQLEQLRGFATVADLIEHARGREVATARPRLPGRGGEAPAVVLAGDGDPDPAAG